MTTIILHSQSKKEQSILMEVLPAVNGFTLFNSTYGLRFFFSIDKKEAIKTAWIMRSGLFRLSFDDGQVVMCKAA